LVPNRLSHVLPAPKFWEAMRSQSIVISNLNFGLTYLGLSYGGRRGRRVLCRARAARPDPWLDGEFPDQNVFYSYTAIG
jgi:hypothetical protein